MDIQDTDITFSPGDSAAIFPENAKDIVTKTIKAMQATAEDKIISPQTSASMTLDTFLTKHANISRVDDTFLSMLAKHSTNEKLTFLLNNEQQRKSFLQNHELWDLLEELAPPTLPLQEICNHLQPMMPRYYSIASSQKTLPNKMELIVALVTYTTSSIQRYGVTTNFLCNIAKEKETKVPLFIQKMPQFHLPKDPASSIIMVGPGVGIAPFRAFLQERIATNASGKNWLFFGEQRQKCDFYYEDFFQQLVQENKLRLDIAFSRDQDTKIYVQDKLYENKKDIWRWLEEGAYLYICGDALRMAKDVETTLCKILQEEGSLSLEKAQGLYSPAQSTKTLSQRRILTGIFLKSTYRLQAHIVIVIVPTKFSVILYRNNISIIIEYIRKSKRGSYHISIGFHS